MLALSIKEKNYWKKKKKNLKKYYDHTNMNIIIKNVI